MNKSRVVVIGGGSSSWSHSTYLRYTNSIIIIIIIIIIYSFIQMLSWFQMNYARYFYTEYFPDLHGSVIHIDDDCIVQGKHLK